MKTFNTSTRVALVAAMGLLAGASMSAHAALQLTTTGPDGTGINNAYHFDFATNPSDAQIAAGLNTITPGLGVTAATLPAVLLKNDQGNPPTANTGALKDSYSVTYITPASPESVSITYVLGQSYFDTTKLTWLLAKDGKEGHWLWNLTGIWDGKTEIQINNLYPDQGSFSHIEIGGVAVPEPSTYIAGGLALLPLLFGLRARFAKKA